MNACLMIVYGASLMSKKNEDIRTYYTTYCRPPSYRAYNGELHRKYADDIYAYCNGLMSKDDISKWLHEIEDEYEKIYEQEE
jgi:hypothetical protein